MTANTKMYLAKAHTDNSLLTKRLLYKPIVTLHGAKNLNIQNIETNFGAIVCIYTESKSMYPALTDEHGILKKINQEILLFQKYDFSQTPPPSMD